MDEFTLREMWEEAQIRFNKQTGKSLRQPLTLKDALSNIDAKLKPSDPKIADKQRKIKSAATEIIKLVQLLGGLAAQGASIVFGPANMCFNALQILLDIPSKISKVYDDLNKLLEDVATFMKQFQIYQRIEQITTLDIEFRQSVHKLLIAFVDICAISFEFCDRRASNIFKRNSKIVLFDDDSGVGAALDNFQRLSAQHSNISDAVTLERVVQGQSEASGGMKRLWDKLNDSAEVSSEKFRKLEDGVDKIANNTDLVVKDVNERKDKELRLELIKKLSSKLGVSVSADRKDNPLVQLRNKILTGSGTWLNELDAYNDWTDLTNRQRKLLILSGGQGSGKSFLLSIIHDQLENQYRRSQDRTVRLSTAAYAFKGGEKASGNTTNRTNQTVQALRHLAIQLANDDPVYLKNLNSYLYPPKDSSGNAQISTKDGSAEKDTKISDVFSELFSSTTMPGPSDNYYVLFLEGIDQLPQIEARSLIAVLLRIETPQLKVALSLSPETIRRFLDQEMTRTSLRSPYAETVEVEQHNIDDLHRFVRDELEDDKIFQSNAAEMQMIVDDLQNKVPDIAQGSFYTASVIIGSVREAVESEKDLNTILELISADTLNNIDLACEKAIRELRTSLSNREIEQLNEILIWTIYGKMYFDAPKMRSALFLLTEKTMFQDLVEKVNEKFSRLLKLSEDETFAMRDPGMEDYFRRMPRLKEGTDGINEYADEPRITMQISITNAKASHVRRFFWDLSEKIVLDKLDHFSFTDQNTSREAEIPIGANGIDGGLVILRRCFDLLFDEEKTETLAIENYATRNILSHVPSFQTDEEKAIYTPSEKQYVTEQLIQLLQNPDCMEVHLTQGFFEDKHMLVEVVLPDIEAFLSDPVATAKLRVKEQYWARNVIESGIESIFRGVAIMVARMWLGQAGWDAQFPYMWLAEYCHLLTNQREDYDPDNEDGDVINNGVDSEQDEACDDGTDNGVEQNTERNDSDNSDNDNDDDGDDAGSEQQLTNGTEIEIENTDSHGQPLPGKSEERQEADGVRVLLENDTAVPDEDGNALSEKPYNEIEAVAEWVKHDLGFSTEDNALWYERLGLTYLHRLENPQENDSPESTTTMHEAGKNAFIIAKQATGSSSRLSQSLARIHAIGKNFEDAVSEVDLASNELRSIEGRDEQQQSRFVQSLLDSSKWRTQLGRMEEAVHILEEVIKETPDTFQGRYELFKLFYDARQVSDAIDFIKTMNNQTREGSILTELAQFVLYICSLEDPQTIFEEILTITHGTEAFALVLDTLDVAHKSLHSTEPIDSVSDEIVALSLCYGVALARYDTSENHIELALPYLKQSIQFGFEQSENKRNKAAYLAARCFFNCAFSEAHIPRDVAAEALDHKSEIRAVLHDACEHSSYGSEVRLMLASFYRLSQQYEDAERLLKTDVQCAFGLLSDDDPENDYQGYTMLGVVLNHTGDELNALSAFSLRGPLERYKDMHSPVVEDNDGDCGYSCDGKCDNLLTWSSRVWFCKVCDDVQFCTPCLTKLREGSLIRPVCSQDHEWLLVPSWKSEFEATGKDKVRMGGTLSPANGQLQDGNRSGGEIVPIEQWLDTIREKWGLKKPSETE